MNARQLLGVILLALLVSSASCATKIGSRTLPSVRASYNEALATSADEQMLLNLVRFRFQHSPQFLELSSIVTQYSLTRNLGVSGAGNFVGPGSFAPKGTIGGDASVSATERPTVTYVPLQGEEFVRRLVKPVPADTVMMLADSGWPIDLLIACCVHQINDLYAPVISSLSAPKKRFHRLANVLERLRAAHRFHVEIETSDEEADVWLIFREGPKGQLDADARTALELLGVSQFGRRFRVTSRGGARRSDEVRIKGRSLLGVMFYLSQGVSVSADDRAARKLGVSVPIAQPILDVRAQSKPPKHSSVRVHYRDRWYYIDDHDDQSKKTFGLLQFFFSVLSAPAGSGPLLTVPTG